MGVLIPIIIIIVATNGIILRTLLSTKTWPAIRVQLILAVVAPMVGWVCSRYLLNETLPSLRGLPTTIAFGITGQILMFYFRNLILVKMREVRAQAFGQKIAPSQGFAKDYLLHIPQMRTEGIVFFLIITIVEVALLVLPHV